MLQLNTAITKETRYYAVNPKNNSFRVKSPKQNNEYLEMLLTYLYREIRYIEFHRSESHVYSDVLMC
jgi:phage terminase large subunit-like protein